MDFFAQQDRARKQSMVFLAVFLAVMLGFVFVVHALASVPGYWSGQADSLWAISPLSLAITSVVSLIVIVGSWVRYKDVQAGGAQLASRFGATELVRSSSSKPEKELLDVVAEMSIAAAIPAPVVFCLRQESSINAFVVGSEDDIALVVSKGALNNLDRDELQAVVGHEFGHIVNGDLAHNMRLLVALGGLNALDEFGAGLNRRAFRKTTSITKTEFGNYEESSYYALPLFVFGVALRVLGSIGVLAGGIVKSSFSRQRELLADASSVQFTRSTYGLASALDKISGYQRGPALHSKYNGELAHICFQVPVRSYSIGRVFDTHPPIPDRISAIDRHFSVKARKRKARAEHGLAKEGVVSEQLASGRSLPGGVLSPELSEYKLDQQSGQAMLFALFVSESSELAENYFRALSLQYDNSFSANVRQIHQSYSAEIETKNTQIIKHVSPTLRTLEPQEKARLVKNLVDLVDVENDNALQKYAVLQVVRQQLDFEQTQSNTQEVSDSQSSSSADIKSCISCHSNENQNVIANTQLQKHAVEEHTRSINELGNELSLLFSLMVEASGYSGERVTQEYTRILKCYTVESLPLRSSKEPGVTDELERALLELVKLPLAQRKALLEHCFEIMTLDGISMGQEVALVNLFAASLDVPDQLAA